MKIPIFLIPFVLMIAESVSDLRGYPLYVAKTGNDANTGTFALPFLTIGAANAAAAGTAGVTEIRVLSGTYVEQVTVPKSSMRYTAVQPGAVIIDGASSTKGFYATGRSDVIVDGFVIKNPTNGVHFVSVTGGAIRNCVITGSTLRPVHVETSSAIAIDRCLSTAAPDSAAFDIESSTSVTVTDCESTGHTLRGFFAHGSGSSVVFTRCVAYTPLVSSGYGFETEDSADAVTFKFCWAWNNFHGFITKTSTGNTYIGCVSFANQSGGFYAKAGTNNRYYHCTTVGNSNGFVLDDNLGGDPSTGNTIKNCIIVGNTGYQINAANGSQVGLVSDYNAFYAWAAFAYDGASRNSLALWQARGYDANSTATTAPNFAVSAYQGFQLPSGNALLTFGTNIPSVSNSATPALGPQGALP